jgi:apolipoprotein N-acyltransferase
LVIVSHFPTAMIDQSPFLKFLTPVVLLGVYLAESRSRRFHERTNFRWFVLEGMVIWVGIEVIRGLIVGTGGFIGYAFYRVLVVVQPISIFGIYGLSLLAMLINYALSLLVIAPQPIGLHHPIGSWCPCRWRAVGRSGWLSSP